jgi:hypothetical protein
LHLELNLINVKGSAVKGAPRTLDNPATRGKIPLHPRDKAKSKGETPLLFCFVFAVITIETMVMRVYEELLGSHWGQAGHSDISNVRMSGLIPLISGNANKKPRY